MPQSLEGKRIAFLATDGVEQSELEQPWHELQKAGAKVELLSVHKGAIQAVRHMDKGDTFEVDGLVADAKAEDYDGLVLPGGVANPDTLRANEKAVRFVRQFFEQSKPVAAICHGPWTLVEAGVLSGRTLTSWPSLTSSSVRKNTTRSVPPYSRGGTLSASGATCAIFIGGKRVCKTGADARCPPSGDLTTAASTPAPPRP